MQQELANLIDILQEQRDIQSSLVALSERKIAVIAAGDVDTLSSITEQEQQAVSCIAAVERKQTACVENLARLMGRPVAELRLAAVIEHAHGQQKQILSKLREELTALVEKQVQYNDMNRKLLEMNMDYIQFILNRTTREAAAPTYGSAGDMQRLPQRTRLLDRKV